MSHDLVCACKAKTQFLSIIGGKAVGSNIYVKEATVHNAKETNQKEKKIFLSIYICITVNMYMITCNIQEMFITLHTNLIINHHDHLDF